MNGGRIFEYFNDVIFKTYVRKNTSRGYDGVVGRRPISQEEDEYGMKEVSGLPLESQEMTASSMPDMPDIAMAEEDQQNEKRDDEEQLLIPNPKLIRTIADRYKGNLALSSVSFILSLCPGIFVTNPLPSLTKSKKKQQRRNFYLVSYDLWKCR